MGGYPHAMQHQQQQQQQQHPQYGGNRGGFNQMNRMGGGGGGGGVGGLPPPNQMQPPPPQQSSAAASSNKQEQYWECQSCTFVNSTSSGTCRICNNPQRNMGGKETTARASTMNTFEPRFGILPNDLVETRQKLIRWFKPNTTIVSERILSDMNKLGCYELLIDACKASKNGIDGYYDDCVFALEKYNQLDQLDLFSLSQICLIPPYNQFKDIHCKNNIILAFTCICGTPAWTAPYIMVMHPQLLYRFIGKLSVGQLARRLSSQQTKCNVVQVNMDRFNVESKARHLKKLRVD
eukprot:510363_1